MKRRLSLQIPLILVMVSVTSSVLVYLQEVRYDRAAIEKNAIREVGIEMSQLQNVLYNRLTAGDEEEGLLSLSLAAMRPGMRTLLLADADQRVMLSNRYRTRGERADGDSAFFATDAFMAVQSGVSRLAYNAQEPTLLQGYFPLIVSYKRGGLDKEIGVLYVEFDITDRLHEAKHNVLIQSLVQGGISLAAALFIALLLHRLVSRRVRTLLEASARLGEGDYTAATHIEGSDELADLGRMFDGMALKVGEAVASREQALVDQKRVLQTAVDGYWHVDGEGRLLDVNDAYCLMSGYTREELLGMRIADLEVREETPEAVRQHMERIFAQGHDRFETLHRGKGGKFIEVEVAVSYWSDVHQFFVFIRDIGERKRLVRALQREHERQQEAERIGSFGSWELECASGTLICSEEIARLFELDLHGLSATFEALQKVIHPEDSERYRLAYSRSLEDQHPYQMTHRLLMSDGRVKWVESRCRSDFDGAGKAVRSIGTVQDVTRREMLATELRIAAVAFETQEAILVTDRNARIIRVNHAFEQATGYSQEEVLGRNPHMLNSGRHDAAFYRQMWEAINRDGRWSGEMWDRRKDGSIYPKWLTITAVRDGQEITHYVGVFIDITERKQAEEEIRNLAFYDPLTRLPNRRLMLDRLRQGILLSGRNGSFGALMFIDLDYFKVLNDTKGHEYGDLLLVEVAERLGHCVRESDSVARFGGDEFVVLLEGLSGNKEEAVAQSSHVAEKIRDVLAQPYSLKDSVHQSSPSIGVTLFSGDRLLSDELLKQADMAMYQAKEGGRNQVRFFEISMQAVLEARTLMENALREAQQNGELELYYQLQTNVERELLGAEVLLRWNSPVLGRVSPADFIPLAEKSNQILSIGQWVLESACRQIKAWESHPRLGSMHLAVNISPNQFHQPDFVRQVKALLEQTGADPHKLELELTENLVLDDVAEAATKMEALRQIGVRFSMDDFGTGYFSLQYIKRLPIDLLKIDQSFVRDILTDPGDAVMVQTIAGMAHNFGFEVIAEGVETSAQLAPLIERGCRLFQGYLFSRPLPREDFERLVEGWGG